MIASRSRYGGPPARVAKGWSLERLTPPSRLNGANGLSVGPDGRLYCAQVPGSCISAIDVDSGAIETISAMGGPIVAPDDLVFDEAGNFYATEITEGRVCMRSPGGKTRVIQGDIPVANPITWHQGRLIAGECRIGARIMELDRDGGAPRIIKADVPMANAFQVGPDGRLYAPIMGVNEIWAIDLVTGEHEVVAGDLGVPDSVKFDSTGCIVTTQVMSGQVLRLDIQSGRREILADLGPGLDNVAFIGDRIFVSSIPGEITEILAPGKTRAVVPRALQWPLGLGIGADRSLMVVDGGFSYTLAPGGTLQLAFMLFTPGGPGYARGVCAGSRSGEWFFTTGMGGVCRFVPGEGEAEWLGNGYNQLMGIDRSGGAVVFAEYGTGRLHAIDGGEARVIADGLDKPMGVALDGATAYVAEAGAGRVVRVRTGQPVEPIVDGLGRPEGLCISGEKLFVTDNRAKTLMKIDPASGAASVIASGLPIGAPVGVTTMPWLGPIGDMSGPMINFADVTAGPDGTLYVAADAEGSVLTIRQAD